MHVGRWKGLDKALRFVWTLLPKRTLLFGNHGDGIAQVRFPKNPIAKFVGKHRVGQYMFVNFPELSLTEWHPFSVASGPREDFVELYIRDLGDHTKRIVALSKRCAMIGRQTWIRADGPYGVHDFNYRRYEVLVLAGGGVGITPVIGLLKDIYGTPSDPPPMNDDNRCCMRCVYAVWVMPHRSDADTFLSLLEHQVRVAAERPDLPALVVEIYCTREKGPSAVQSSKLLHLGRPKFTILMDRTGHEHTDTASTLVFACGPGRMVNELWDESIKRTSAMRRIDFHHETFEF
eukprot:m.78999 g.78999  ORF g.78999 m.78999 type:complete len:290 (-) comp16261_c0_seq2:420-1289(-)